MAKFRWRKGELDKLDKEIKKYNRTINKMIKEGFTKSQLPEKKNYYTERDKIVANEEKAREYTNELFKIFKIVDNPKNKKIVSNENNLSLPMMTKKITELKVKSINKQREKERKYYEKLETTSRNKPIHPANQKDVETEFRTKKFDFNKMDKRDWKWFQKTMGEYDRTEKEKQEQYKINFLNSIQNSDVMTPSEKIEFTNVIGKISDSKLLEMYYKDKDMDIMSNYEPSEQRDYIQSLIESWNKVAMESKVKED